MCRSSSRPAAAAELSWQPPSRAPSPPGRPAGVAGRLRGGAGAAGADVGPAGHVCGEQGGACGTCWWGRSLWRHHGGVGRRWGPWHGLACRPGLEESGPRWLGRGAQRRRWGTVWTPLWQRSSHSLARRPPSPPQNCRLPLGGRSWTAVRPFPHYANAMGFLQVS